MSRDVVFNVNEIVNLVNCKKINNGLGSNGLQVEVVYQNQIPQEIVEETDKVGNDAVEPQSSSSQIELV